MSMSTESYADEDPRRVLLFVRAPQRGQVKTRLATRLGADRTLALYRCFVEDIITTLKAGSLQTSVFYTPKGQGPQVQAWLGRHARCYPQIGSDLGQRMHAALTKTLCEPVRQAVLIGSDFPDLGIEVIQEAFAALQANDVVIGPAKDGGYYLIGFQKKAFNGDIFKGIKWGTSQVFQQTLAQIKQANLTYHTLPTWQDIDTYEDLRSFYDQNKSGGRALKTMAFLNQLFS